ncbi:hypothetical protein C8J56DRAFT_528754 [Mycena floridula]|nr:hypothetical protein C8J56DRAFT_528754 [Mycena floridula]
MYLENSSTTSTAELNSSSSNMDVLTLTRHCQDRRGVALWYFPSHVNPHMASRPGDPGLLFVSRRDLLEKKDGPLSFFVQRKTPESHMRWEYLGGYNTEDCGRISAEDFKAQDPKASNTETFPYVLPKYTDQR